MSNLSSILSIAATALILAVVSAPASAEHMYVGVDSCKICHKRPDTGDQYGKLSTRIIRNLCRMLMLLAGYWLIGNTSSDRGSFS